MSILWLTASNHALCCTGLSSILGHSNGLPLPLCVIMHLENVVSPTLPLVPLGTQGTPRGCLGRSHISPPLPGFHHTKVNLSQ